MSDFTLSGYFNSFDYDKILDEISDPSSKLESITNSMADNPDMILFNDDVFEDVLDMIHNYKGLEMNHKKQFAYLIASSFKTVCNNVSHTMTSGDFVDSLAQAKALLERYAYIVFVILTVLGKEDFTGLSSKTKTNKSQINNEWKANCTQTQDLLDIDTNSNAKSSEHSDCKIRTKKNCQR